MSEKPTRIFLDKNRKCSKIKIDYIMLNFNSECTTKLLQPSLADHLVPRCRIILNY